MMCIRKREKSVRLFMKRDEAGNNWFIDQDGVARKQVSWKTVANTKVEPFGYVNHSNHIDTYENQNGIREGTQSRRARRKSSLLNMETGETLSIESLNSVVEALNQLKVDEEDFDDDFEDDYDISRPQHNSIQDRKRSHVESIASAKSLKSKILSRIRGAE